MVESCRLLCLTSVYVVYLPICSTAVTIYKTFSITDSRVLQKDAASCNMENKALQDAVVDCTRSTHHDASESCCYCNQHRVAKALTRVLRFVCVDMGICS
ncbi:hypothetical protein SCA6_004719 [Theobroma cacao]